NFDIDHPGIDEPVPLVGSNVAIVVIDNGDHDSFLAKIVDSCDTSTPSTANTVPLVNTPGTNTWTGSAPAGFLDPFDILEAMKKVIVFGTVLGTGTVAKSNNFRIVKGGAVTCSAS